MNDLLVSLLALLGAVPLFFGGAILFLHLLMRPVRWRGQAQQGLGVIGPHDSPRAPRVIGRRVYTCHPGPLRWLWH